MSAPSKTGPAFLAAALALLAAAGCEETTYPEPTEFYSAVGGFEITRAGDENPGPYSVGEAEGDPEWGFWFPYSIALTVEGNLLVTNIRGGYIERFITNPDGSAIWDAYWVWPRGLQHATYQLFIDSVRGLPSVGELVLVSESQSEFGPAGFEWGRQVHRLKLPEPILDDPDDNRPRYAIITQFDVLFAYPVMPQPGPVACFPEERAVFTDVMMGWLLHAQGDSITAQGGGDGDQEGRFYRPLGIAVNPDEEVVVSDTFNHRLQTFTLEPTPEDPDDTDHDPDYAYPYIFRHQRTIGSFGFHPGELSSPYGVETDAEGNIYVCDTRNARIQKFTQEGELLAVIRGEGYWRLRCPLDVVVTEEGDLWVVDVFLWYGPWEGEYLPEDQARIILFRRN